MTMTRILMHFGGHTVTIGWHRRTRLSFERRHEIWVLASAS